MSKIENSSRTHIVACLNCADCGGLLRLSYEPSDKARANMASVHNGITGADKVEVRVYVESCKKCVGELRKPLEALRTAFAALGPAA